MSRRKRLPSVSPEQLRAEEKQASSFVHVPIPPDFIEAGAELRRHVVDPGHHFVDQAGNYLQEGSQPNFSLVLPSGKVVQEWRKGNIASPEYAVSQTIPTRVETIGEKTKMYFLAGPIVRPKLVPGVVDSVKIIYPQKTTLLHLHRSPSLKKIIIYDDARNAVHMIRKIMLPIRREDASKIEDLLQSQINPNEDEPIETHYEAVGKKYTTVYLDPLDPSNYITTRMPRLKNAPTQCSKYAVLQIHNTCHAYAAINLFLLTPDMRNYAVRVMHGIMRKQAGLGKKLQTAYAKGSLTEIVASMVYRRVCETDFSISSPVAKTPFSTSGVCFFSYLMGEKNEGRGGFASLNFVILMSALGLRGILTPRDIFSLDVTYMLHIAYPSLRDDFVVQTIKSNPRPQYGKFTLVGMFYSFKILPPGKPPICHVVACAICNNGTRIVFDSNHGAFVCNWLEPRAIDAVLTQFYPFQYCTGSHSTLVFLDTGFLAEQASPVVCKSTDDFVDADSILTQDDLKLIKRSYDAIIESHFDIRRYTGVFFPPLNRVDLEI